MENPRSYLRSRGSFLFKGEGRNLEDAREGGGGEEEEAPAAETPVFYLRPQFNNVTALRQQTNRLTI